MKQILLLFILLCGLNPAQAFVTRLSDGGGILRWDLGNFSEFVPTNSVNPQTRAIRYYLGAQAFSSTNTTAELNAIRNSFNQWQSISGTHLKFEEAGLVTNPEIDVNDETNVVFWSQTTLVNNGMSSISGRLGVAFISFIDDGTIAQGDIVLNAAENRWFTDFFASSTNYFPEGVLAHEIGHFLGLDHSPVGGASMMHSGEAGVNIQTGLSSDEIRAARALYPASNTVGTLGVIKGQARINGLGILGAVVILENMAGNIVAGTLTRSTGNYEMGALEPGNYNLRVTPLDSSSSGRFLIRGSQINVNAPNSYANAVTAFQPTTNQSVSISAGTTNTLNINLASGAAPFNIGLIRKPSSTSGNFSIIALPISLQAGVGSRFVGVFSANLPTSGATLIISGDGITHGATTFHPAGNPFAGLSGISVGITVASNATPGLRSFLVQQGTNRVYANGFLEILPPVPDYNFDGLSDLFQRQHFPLFTSPSASPAFDADGDSASNAAEAAADTNPNDATSVLKLESVGQDLLGTHVSWRSSSGKLYQLYGRSNLNSGGWTPIGLPTPATGSLTTQTDLTSGGFKYYRVEVLP